MRKLFSVLAISVASLAAFAQGKISFETDSLHLVYWAYSGQPVNDPSLAVDLYMGTSSSQLFLYSSTTFSTIAGGEGRWNAASVQATANATTGAPLINGGTTVFVEVQVRDANKTAPGIFTGDSAGYILYGKSSEFSFLLGSGITYPALWGANGNWPVGTFNMDGSSYGTGARGAIAVGIPEPSKVTLAGLGAAAMLLFHRKPGKRDGKEKCNKSPEI